MTDWQKAKDRGSFPTAAPRKQQKAPVQKTSGARFLKKVAHKGVNSPNGKIYAYEMSLLS